MEATLPDVPRSILPCLHKHYVPALILSSALHWQLKDSSLPSGDDVTYHCISFCWTRAEICTSILVKSDKQGKESRQPDGEGSLEPPPSDLQTESGLSAEHVAKDLIRVMGNHTCCFLFRRVI